MRKFKIGDKINYASPVLPFGISCEVIEVDNGRIIKAKAEKPYPLLGICGFFQEGDNYVIIEWKISSN